jgi:hypothetical protein
VARWQVPQSILGGSQPSLMTFRIGNVTGKPPQPLYKLRQHAVQVLCGRQHLTPSDAAVAPPRDKLQAAALALCTVVDFKRTW